MSSSILMGCLKAEYLKARRGSLLWITALLPVIVFLLAFFLFPGWSEPENALTKTENLWNSYVELYFGFFLVALLPILVILIASLYLKIESRDESWKKIFTLPVSRAHIYFSKLLFLILHLIAVLLVLLIVMIVEAYILQLFHPELNFSSYILPWSAILLPPGLLIVGLLGMLAVHYVCCLLMRSHMLIVIFGLLVAFLSTSPLAKVFPPIRFFPQSFPYLSMTQQPSAGEGFFASLDSARVLSILYFIIAIGIGFLLFNRNNSFGSRK